MRNLEQLFKGLADQTRLRILNLLIHGELCVCDIHYVLESSQSNVSRHLTYLKNSGLVLDRREGTRMYYRLEQPSEASSQAAIHLSSSSISVVRDSRRGLAQAEEGHRKWLVHGERMETLLRVGPVPRSKYPADIKGAK